MKVYRYECDGILCENVCNGVPSEGWIEYDGVTIFLEGGRLYSNNDTFYFCCVGCLSSFMEHTISTVKNR